MPTKIFTLLGGQCPFGKGIEIDSQSCRKCGWFYRAGTGTFFWCNHPIESPKIEQDSPKIERITPEIAQKTPKNKRKSPEKEQSTKKRGRPAKKAFKKPVNRKKTKK